MQSRTTLKSRRMGKRASKPKVRSGCRTCKVRHVKCDEAKPCCRRCLKNGYLCDGYDAPPNSTRLSVRPILPNDDNLAYPLTISSSVPTLPFQDETEYWYFQTFREGLAPQLAASYRSPVWNQIMLQFCQEESFVRNLVFAIAALHASRAPAACTSLGPSLHYKRALQQYDKALKALRQELSIESADIRKALVSCLLIFAFESLHGEYSIAIWQANAGYKLLQTRAKTPQWRLTQVPLTVDDELVYALSRLDLQVMTVLDAKTTALHRLGKDSGREIMQSMPPTFADFANAQMYWELTMRQAAHFIHIVTASATETSATCTENVDLPRPHRRENGCEGSKWIDFGSSIHTPFPTSALPQAAREDQARHSADIASWKRASRHFLSSSNPSVKAAATALYVHACATGLVLETMLVMEECGLDRFLPDFENILSMAQQFVTCSSSLSGGVQLPAARFSVDIGILPAMYVVVLMCRDRRVRRGIIEMLRQTRRREGIWDGMLIAEIGTWVMTLEEQDAVDGYIPEHARVRMSKVEVDMHKKVANLKCFKRVAGSHELEILKTTIHWD